MHALFLELRFTVMERKGQIPYLQWLERQGKQSKNERQLHGVLVLRRHFAPTERKLHPDAY